MQTENGDSAINVWIFAGSVPVLLDVAVQLNPGLRVLLIGRTDTA